MKRLVRKKVAERKAVLTKYSIAFVVSIKRFSY